MKKKKPLKKSILIVIIMTVFILISIPVFLLINENRNMSPEERLVGTWIQTQESLDYNNDNVHSESVNITEKETLEILENGVCVLTGPYIGTVEFFYKYKDGYLIMTADGWALQRLLLDKHKLIDPETEVVKFKKQ